MVELTNKKHHILPTGTHTNNGSDVCGHRPRESGTDFELKGDCPFVSISLVDSLLGTSWYYELKLVSQIKVSGKEKGQEMIKFRFSTIPGFAKSVLRRNGTLAIMLCKILTENYLAENF